jgi:hypothetical protein
LDWSTILINCCQISAIVIESEISGIFFETIGLKIDAPDRISADQHSYHGHDEMLTSNFLQNYLSF